MHRLSPKGCSWPFGVIDGSRPPNDEREIWFASKRRSALGTPSMWDVKLIVLVQIAVLKPSLFFASSFSGGPPLIALIGLRNAARRFICTVISKSVKVHSQKWTWLFLNASRIFRPIRLTKDVFCYDWLKTTKPRLRSRPTLLQKDGVEQLSTNSAAESHISATWLNKSYPYIDGMPISFLRSMGRVSTLLIVTRCWPFPFVLLRLVSVLRGCGGAHAVHLSFCKLQGAFCRVVERLPYFDIPYVFFVYF